MAENPYDPPSAEVVDTPLADRPGSIWKGVVIGALVDLAGTLVAGIGLVFIYTLINAAPGMSPEAIAGLTNRYYAEAMGFDSVWGLMGLALGSGFSVLGGYVCARFARRRWKPAALILGVVMAVFGIASGTGQISLPTNIAMGLSSLVFVWFGAWLYGRNLTSAGG